MQGQNMQKILLVILMMVQFGCAGETYYLQNGEKIPLLPHDNSLRNAQNIDYYTNDKGVVLGVSDTLVVKVKSGVSIQAIMKKYDLELVKNLSENLYLLQATHKNLTLQSANSLSQEEGVVYAQPDFVKKILPR